MFGMSTKFLAAMAFMAAAGTASAQVGEPTGSFGIKITQGSTTIVDTTVTVPSDIKLSDSTPESYVQLGSLAVTGDPIILKMVSDDDPYFRIVHFYVDVPADLNDIYYSGGASLVDPLASAAINVTISNLAFTNTTEVTPLIVNNNTFLTAFMRDDFGGTGGRFYDLPGANYYPPGWLSPFAEAQVPGAMFFDGDPTQYAFNGSWAQPTATWSWLNLPNPGAVGADAINADGTLSAGNGKVFELGLSVAFVGVPEPGTAALLISAAGLVFIRRRR